MSVAVYPLDVGELDPHGVEGDGIDFEHRALGVQETDELNHGVEGDPGELLAILLRGIARRELGTPDSPVAAEIGAVGGRHVAQSATVSVSDRPTPIVFP
jgi:hypothetical protein